MQWLPQRINFNPTSSFLGIAWFTEQYREGIGVNSSLYRRAPGNHIFIPPVPDAL